ncbi:MAG: hypothetical protein ABSA45_00190 [Verrucomicrobiota bacterium]|jgi:hypothetical protein
MKLPPSISGARDQTGVLLLECIVYIAIFALILGLGLATFFLCWDNSKALLYATDDISAALRAGERWRADVRSATGKITVETTSQGEFLRIPHGTNAILYSFSAGEIHRQLASSDFSESLLPTVNASQMVLDKRGPVSAWRWELELKSRRKETHLPLLFTFEAAAETAP